MKKVILILAALVLVASGVAAVSAYEAHMINVKAHVENALSVNTTDVDFGTVFPQEWEMRHRSFELSESAVNATVDEELLGVTVQMFAEWKPSENRTFFYEDPIGSGNWTQSSGYYNWMGYFTYLGWDTNTNAPAMIAAGPGLIGDPPVGAPGTVALPIAGNFTLTDDTSHTMWIGIDVPVFEGYSNNLTDPTPKPSGLDDPTWEAPIPPFDEEGTDFGIDLKFQVIDIIRP